MSYTVSILGSNGMLGWAAARVFESHGAEVLRVDRGAFDVAKDPIEKLLPSIRSSSLVLNCIGVIKPRISGLDPVDVLRINGLFPGELARACSAERVRCIHITTDGVYSGRRGPYTEQDPPDPTDLYGSSKLLGDGAAENAMVIRASIIGEEAGTARSLLEWVRSQAGREVQGFTDRLWNGLTTVYLVDVLEKIIREGLYRNGLFHLHSPNPISKADLISAINEAYGLGLRITRTNSPNACNRTLGSIHPLSRELVRMELPEQIMRMKQALSQRGS